MGFLSSFDLNLLPWIVLIWVVGSQLKKMNLPSWIPPIPVILFLISFLVCSLFGWAHTTQDGLKGAVIAILEYGLGNGALITLVSCYSFDVFKTARKRFPEFKEKVLSIFRRKEAKSGEEG